jgi:hypothetical protein
MPISPEVLSIASGLDESQREAFFHCLTNKLAIIQGPPGTGKTFIGVKLVQALFEMGSTPPFLVMTYKNHALDEFLKHLVKTDCVALNEVVRIGGRSKEEILNGCNLMDYCRASKLYGKEIYEARCEIEELKEKVKNISRYLDYISAISHIDLLLSLSEGQILSLMESYVPKKNKVFKYLPQLRANHPNLQELIRRVVNNEEQGGPEKVLVTEVDKALKKWLPDRQTLLGLRNFQAKLNQKNPTDNEIDADRFDEEDIKQMQDMRMNLFQNQSNGAGKTEHIKENLILLLSNNASDVCFRISDFPDGMDTDIAISDKVCIGIFDESEKLRFVRSKIMKRRQPHIETFEKQLAQLELAMERKREIEELRKLHVLKSAKIVGVTISGASIHRSLLKKLSPQIVVVEEAAEILEPSLLAALSASTEHLILIGDHKQLRPSVETFDLVKNCHFDVSMMERLINCSFPFKSLKKQNRMRPEFSELLRDIYPELEDNLQFVLRNNPLPFMDKSIFFW